MKREFLFFSSICLLFVVSCIDSQQAATQTKIDQVTDSRLFGQADAMLPDFSESSENYISQWPVFDDLITEVLAINQASLTTIQQRSNLLVSRMDSLTRKIPDTLNTQPIYSRVIVTKTRAAIVKQEANKDRLDTLAMQQAIVQMNLATANLIIQINEKFEKDTQDNSVKNNELKEKKMLKKRLDSVYKSSRENNTK
ncbi:hypothetical protein N9P56_02400 [Flavobacteriaceae bacterium]|nr:hypothetical protein [Flavobacteriaceae bacterium]MDB4028620.1 hypothetical protein [Flavobacteriaceae bacterium]MDC1313238.1 hypothetical protein [Flavobacteriaceae bacterium]